MSILLTLLTFLLFISISYFRSQRAEVAKASAPGKVSPKRLAPEMIREAGFEIPRGYSFHPGHTWVLPEKGRDVRIGLDGLAAELIGAIDTISLGPLYRWLRQGEKLCTIHLKGYPVDILSPVEGVVVASNPDLLQNPNLLVSDPYGNGWLLVTQAPFLQSNLRNLLHGPLVRQWMEVSLARLKELISASPTPAPVFAQDGGLLVRGLLLRLEPEARDSVVKEFFLTEAAGKEVRS